MKSELKLLSPSEIYVFVANEYDSLFDPYLGLIVLPEIS